MECKNVATQRHVITETPKIVTEHRTNVITLLSVAHMKVIEQQYM